MGQGGGGPGLQAQPLDLLWLNHQSRGQGLQCHPPVQPVVLGQVDHSHSALADFPLDFIGADPLSRFQFLQFGS